MVEHKCNSCFYMQHENNRHPCNVCEGYNKYVNRNIYIHQPDTVAVSTWDEEDVWIDELIKEKYMEQTDSVNYPKHYILFENLNIEVRDVIERLVDKLHVSGTYPAGAPLFESDYVQLMQYLMRFMEKNGKEDLQKGLWYLNKMLEAYE